MSVFAVFLALLVPSVMGIASGLLMEKAWVISLGMILLLATEVAFGILWAYSGTAVLPVVVIVIAGTVLWWKCSTKQVADSRAQQSAGTRK